MEILRKGWMAIQVGDGERPAMAPIWKPLQAQSVQSLGSARDLSQGTLPAATD
jgi:hypothetical protein